LSPDEVNPSLFGDLKLIDIETKGAAEVTLDRPTLELFRQRFGEWQNGIASQCSKLGVHYVPLTTELPWERVILMTLRDQGVIE
jgi:hypothetical protein